MKKVISSMLILGLLLAALITPASAVSAGEFHGGIYWNDELSVGFELMEKWEYSSEEELRQWNEGWQNAEGHCQMLMQAIYESYVGIVNLTVDQPTDDAVVEMSEEEYLKWQLSTMENNVERVGLELCQNVVEPIYFLGETHFCARVSGAYQNPDDETIGIRIDLTTVVIKRDGIFMGFSASMLQDAKSEDITDTLLMQFFVEKPVVSAGVIDGDTYRNDTFSLCLTLGEEWEFAPNEEIVSSMGYDAAMTRQMILDQLPDGGGMTDMIAANDKTGEMLHLTIEKLAEDCSELQYITEILDYTVSAYARLYDWEGDQYSELYLADFMGGRHPAFLFSGPDSEPGSTLYVTVIALKHGNIMGSITITAASEEAITAIMNCFNHTA